MGRSPMTWRRKEATEVTAVVNRGGRRPLRKEDRRDFLDADRRFVFPLSEPVVGADGHVIASCGGPGRHRGEGGCMPGCLANVLREPSALWDSAARTE